MKAKEGNHTIRRFEIPKLNFDAEDYTELINWQSCIVTVPPLLANLSANDLNRLVAGNASQLIDVDNFPCHTQSVERCVKLVTEASAAFFGPHQRDGFIKTQLQSRNIMPQFETKSDYRRHSQ